MAVTGWVAVCTRASSLQGIIAIRAELYTTNERNSYTSRWLVSVHIPPAMVMSRDSVLPRL